jgi:TAT (twin-arginine translocation) pathway signal sequence
MIIDHHASCTTGPGEVPSASDLSRRGFLQAGAAAGGGLMLTLSCRTRSSASAATGKSS